MSILTHPILPTGKSFLCCPLDFFEFTSPFLYVLFKSPEVDSLKTSWNSFPWLKTYWTFNASTYYNRPIDPQCVVWSNHTDRFLPRLTFPSTRRQVLIGLKPMDLAPFTQCALWVERGNLCPWLTLLGEKILIKCFVSWKGQTGPLLTILRM